MSKMLLRCAERSQECPGGDRGISYGIQGSPLNLGSAPGALWSL